MWAGGAGRLSLPPTFCREVVNVDASAGMLAAFEAEATGAAVFFPYLCTWMADIYDHLGHAKDGLQPGAEALMMKYTGDYTGR